MKKRLMNLIAIVAALGMVFVAGPVMADVDTHDGTTMSGTVPFCASWNLTEGNSTPFMSRVDIAAYDANEILVTDFIKITDFDCNTKFKITATKGAWTLPANYPSAGAKKADGSDSDILLMVDNVTAGYTGRGLAALGDYGSYTAITTGGSDIIGGGIAGVADSHGVENAICDVNAKILMDWPNDIVGAYSIDVTLIISERFE